MSANTQKRRSLISEKMNKSNNPDNSNLDKPPENNNSKFQKPPEQSSQLDKTYKIASWSRGFKYMEYSIQHFNSLFLANNNYFQDCKNMIEGFNEEIRESKKQEYPEIKNGPVKLQFYQCLYSCLFEVLNTNDRNLQKVFVEKVHQWAVKSFKSFSTSKEIKKIQLFNMEEFKPKEEGTKEKSPPSHQYNPNSSAGFQNKSEKRSIRAISASRPDSSQIHQRTKLHSIQNYDQKQIELLKGLPPLRPISADKYSKMGKFNQQALMQQNFKASFRPYTASTRPESGSIQQQNQQRPDSAFTQGSSNQQNQRHFETEQQQQQAIRDEMVFDEYQELQQKFQLQQTGQQLIHPSKAIQDMTPQQFKEEIVRDYELGHRTKHPEYDPPFISIKNYKTKMIEYEDPGKLMQEFMKGYETTEQESKVAYIKPQNYLPQKEEAFDDQDLNQQQKTNEEEDVGEDQKEVQVTEQNQLQIDGQPQQPGEKQAEDALKLKANQHIVGDADIIYVEKEVEEEAKAIKSRMIPDVKNYLDDKVSSDKFNQDLKKKFEQRSTFMYYEPSNNIAEVKMENLWIKKRQEEVQHKREDEELIDYQNEFAKVKARQNKEITRKIDSSIYGSNYKECEFKQKQYTKKEMMKLDRQMTIGEVKKQKIPTEEDLKQKEKDAQQNKYSSKYGLGQQKSSYQEDDENKKQKNYSNDPIITLNQLPDKEEAEESEYEDYVVDDIQQIPATHMPRNRSQTYQVNVTKTEFKDLTQYKDDQVIAKKQIVKPKSFHGLEQQINDKRKAEAFKMFGAMIGIPSQAEQKKIQSEQEYKPEPLPSLTVQSQGKVKPPRPFSAVFTKVDNEKYRDEQMDELQEIKRRMARYKINIPMATLQNALMIPVDVIDEDKKNELPEPGLGLLTNPFFKTKKKKKKKKKKK